MLPNQHMYSNMRNEPLKDAEMLLELNPSPQLGHRSVGARTDNHSYRQQQHHAHLNQHHQQPHPPQMPDMYNNHGFDASQDTNGMMSGHMSQEYWSGFYQGWPADGQMTMLQNPDGTMDENMNWMVVQSGFLPIAAEGQGQMGNAMEVVHWGSGMMEAGRYDEDE